MEFSERSVFLIDSRLLTLEHLVEGEWSVSDTSTIVELAHEFDPMETHGVQEHLKDIHSEQNAENDKHKTERHNEEVQNLDSSAHFSDIANSGLGLSEEDLDEDLTELTVSK